MEEKASIEEVRHCAKRWYELSPGGEAPSARCSHTATLVGASLYVIGGGVFTALTPLSFTFKHFADVPVLNVRTLTWTIALREDSPFPARRGHSAALHDASKRIVVFGGTTGGTQGGERNDVWVLHVADQLSALRWSEIEPSGLRPPPRRGHRAVMCGDTMMVIGGYGRGLMHSLSVEQWAWSTVQVAEGAPELLALFGCALLGRMLLVFGGHNGESCVDSLYCVDLSSIHTEPHSGMGAAKTATEEARPIFWHRLVASGTPPAARFCLELADGGLGNLVVFGGTSENNTALNDTHLRVSWNRTGGPVDTPFLHSTLSPHRLSPAPSHPHHVSVPSPVGQATNQRPRRSAAFASPDPPIHCHVHHICHVHASICRLHASICRVHASICRVHTPPPFHPARSAGVKRIWIRSWIRHQSATP